mgnify:FL=1
MTQSVLFNIVNWFPEKFLDPLFKGSIFYTWSEIKSKEKLWGSSESDLPRVGEN